MRLNPITESCVMCFLPFEHKDFTKNCFKQLILRTNAKILKIRKHNIFLYMTPHSYQPRLGSIYVIL